MQGIIFFWFGSILSIPDGWALCDGTQGTPDLRTKFVIAAGTTYDPADTGGKFIHNHPFTSNDHDHAIPSDNQVAAGAYYDDTTYVASAVGLTGAFLAWPPYHALCYIMKLP